MLKNMNVNRIVAGSFGKAAIMTMGFSLLLNCGKSARDEKKRGPLGPSLSDSREYPEVFESEVDGALVAACKGDQPFAAGTCWDEIFFSDHGGLTLRKNDGTKIQIFRDDGSINTQILAQYELERTENDVRILRHSAISKLEARGSNDYWFLPRELRIDGNAHLREATFRLSGRAYFSGSALLCESNIALPLRVLDIQEKCHINPGQNQQISIKSSSARLNLSFAQTSADARNDHENLSTGVKVTMFRP